jgi:hypothetical protein
MLASITGCHDAYDAISTIATQVFDSRATLASIVDDYPR